MLGGDIVNELYDDNGFAYAGTAKEADLSAPRIGRKRTRRHRQAGHRHYVGTRRSRRVPALHRGATLEPEALSGMGRRNAGDTAVWILKNFSFFSPPKPIDLWDLVIQNLKAIGIKPATTHNNLMDIVLGLWKAGLIR